MKTIITVITASGTEARHEFDMPEEPGYSKIKEVVDPFLEGGFLEHVRVLHEGEYVDMFVDDCSALKGLPRNEKATAIYRNNTLTHEPGREPETLAAIYGPAVLFSRRVWF